MWIGTFWTCWKYKHHKVVIEHCMSPDETTCVEELFDLAWKAEVLSHREIVYRCWREDYDEELQQQHEQAFLDDEPITDEEREEFVRTAHKKLAESDDPYEELSKWAAQTDTYYDEEWGFFIERFEFDD